MKIFGLEIIKEIYMPIIIILLAVFSEKILKLVIKKILNPEKKHLKVDSRKIRTMNSLFINLSKYAIWIFAFLWILSVFGVNTAAIVTGLGVASLVIGLAFQDILKDILAGFSIIFENQFAVGDYVKIGDFSGYVSFLGLKTTKIKAYTGEIKIISNRNISEVINYSINSTFAVVDLPVCYESDLNKVEKILCVAAANMKEKIPNLIGEIEVLGVQELGDSAVSFRIIGKCKPAKHFEVERCMRKEFKNALDKNGIKIPYMQIEVHNEK